VRIGINFECVPNIRIGLGEGDVGAIEYLLQILGLQFLGGPHTKYASALIWKSGLE